MDCYLAEDIDKKGQGLRVVDERIRPELTQVLSVLIRLQSNGVLFGVVVQQLGERYLYIYI